MSCANAMILYLDTSSLLKCLIDEAHTADVLQWVDAAERGRDLPRHTPPRPPRLCRAGSASGT